MNIITKPFSFAKDLPATSTGIVISSIFATLVWEHIGRKRNHKIRPSVGLEIVSEKSRKFFRMVGRGLAWASSYLIQIDLKDIGLTIESVFRPTWNLVTSPFCIISGYIRAAVAYKNKQWMIYIGSALAVLLFSFGIYRYTSNMSLLQFTYLRGLINY